MLEWEEINAYLQYPHKEVGVEHQDSDHYQQCDQRHKEVVVQWRVMVGNMDKVRTGYITLILHFCQRLL